ncbi:MAG: hypothetical protein M9955_17190 [Rhizobiaceae bacterium]|nr:hypothetical protein [Rhizobiaceae bacterium]
MSAAEKHSSLPGFLGEVAEIAGVDAAYAILDTCGGTRVDIPAKARPDHWLSRLVGFETADLICKHFAVQQVKGVRHEMIPLAHRSHARQARKHIAQAIARGVDVRSAARQAGVHERTAWRVKQRMKGDPDGDQGELF